MFRNPPAHHGVLGVLVVLEFAFLVVDPRISEATADLPLLSSECVTLQRSVMLESQRISNRKGKTRRVRQ
jgi:hypothetical protein